MGQTPLHTIMYIAAATDSSEEFIKNLTKNFKMLSFNSGSEAFTKLIDTPDLFSTIIISEDVSDMSAIDLLHKISACSNLKSTPVIMHVERADLEEMNICIRAGARYYLPTSVDIKELLQLIYAAINDYERYNLAERSVLTAKPMQSLEHASFKVQTLQEAQVIAGVMAHSCPNPRLAAVGIAEILINAIEHGNLGIDFDEKTELQKNKMWIEEIERRLLLTANQEKYVSVIFKKTENTIIIRVIDEGSGFDWVKYQNFDANNALEIHGRGIIMARTLAFKDMVYHGCGNDVECMIELV